MSTGWQWAGLLVAGGMLAGCGVPGASGATSGQGGRSATSPFLATTVPAAHPLVPVGVINPPQNDRDEEFVVPLIPGTGMDQVTVRVTPTGSGTLTVRSHGGRRLWTLPDV